MYFLVLYNISDIQKGIQAGHAALEYAHSFNDDEEYQRFVKYHKTWIILNGGTSNENGKTVYSPKPIDVGSMELYHIQLNEFGIKHACFYEPDLNNSLSAISLLADERVYNKKDYPDLYEFYINGFTGELDNIEQYTEITETINHKNAKEIIPERYPKFYLKWINSLGGMKNVYLREFLGTKRLA